MLLIVIWLGCELALVAGSFYLGGWLYSIGISSLMFVCDAVPKFHL